jgi:hypothetical protein
MARRTLVAAAVVATAVGLGVWLGRLSVDVGGLPDGNGRRVATVGKAFLHASDLRAALADDPASARGGGEEGVKRALEELARARLLALRAIEKGYDRDPDLVRRYSRQLAQVYVDKELASRTNGAAPSDEDLRAWFEAHRSEFARDERARVALVSFLVSSPSERDAKRAKAVAALKEAGARAGQYYAFGDLARRRSEDPATSTRNGELGELTRDQMAAAAGAEVATAAFSMAEPGVYDRVVETSKGFHVLKLLSRAAAFAPQLEELRETVRARLVAERRGTRRKAVLDAALKGADIQIDEAALKEVLEGLRTN